MDLSEKLSYIFCEKRKSYSKKYAIERLTYLIYLCTGDRPTTKSFIVLLIAWSKVHKFKVKDRALLDHYRVRYDNVQFENVRTTKIKDFKLESILPANFPIPIYDMDVQFIVKSILIVHKGKMLFHINAVRYIKGKTYFNFTLRTVHDLSIFNNFELGVGRMLKKDQGVHFKKIVASKIPFILRHLMAQNVKFYE